MALTRYTRRQLRNLANNRIPAGSIREAIRGIIDALAFEVADETALAEIKGYEDGQEVYVVSNDSEYRFQSDATEGVKPDDIDEEDPGRWVAEAGGGGGTTILTTGVVMYDGKDVPSVGPEDATFFLASGIGALNVQQLAILGVMVAGTPVVPSGTYQFGYAEQGGEPVLISDEITPDSPVTVVDLDPEVEIPEGATIFVSVSGVGQGQDNVFKADVIGTL